ncbi:MAG TPA: efflux RND transporter permease subunit, partial [Caulobacteraceae bacterium]|nr:efflux RND transporter permease subunit [Caulobacteraceae bacterium]
AAGSVPGTILTLVAIHYFKPLSNSAALISIVLGIALVLTAVLLPMAFFGGSTGVIYRQFSVTMVSAVLLSVFVALTLSPALCATVLKPQGHKTAQKGFFGWFNRTFDKSLHRYERGLHRTVGRSSKSMMWGYGVIVAVMIGLFAYLPSGFLPEEDQGLMLTTMTLPVGAVKSRTDQILKSVEQEFLVNEKANTAAIFTVQGRNFSGSGENTGLAFLRLKPWDQRKGANNGAGAIARRASIFFATHIRDAQVYTLVPPAVPELGLATGFDMQLENRGGLNAQQFLAARNQLLAAAAADPQLSQVRFNGLEDQPQLQVDTDTAQAGALGVAQGDINSTLSAALGGTYVNDFIDRDRIKHVYVEGDAPYRARPENLNDWRVRNASGTMTPFSAFAKSHWTFGAAQLARYNGFQSYEIQGQPKPGSSTGAAMAEMQKLAAQLPPGVGVDWTGVSYQEQAAGAQAPVLYGLTVLVVFLCLAALYESWSIPLSVMLVLPLGIVGALLAASLRGLYNDIYFQVGLLTTMGLAAKNAILIVEFAVEAQRQGQDAVQAAIGAARQRLRPILMTSLAFIAGVLPLALANGAGAGSENDIGTGVVGGMISATILAIFFVPLGYVLVRKAFPTPLAKTGAAAPRGEGG